MRFRARGNCGANLRRRLLNGQAGQLYVAAIGHPRFKLATRLNVVAADPLERPAQRQRRPVARTRSDGTGGERHADQTDRRGAVRGYDQVR